MKFSVKQLQKVITAAKNLDCTDVELRENDPRQATMGRWLLFWRSVNGNDHLIHEELLS